MKQLQIFFFLFIGAINLYAQDITFNENYSTNFYHVGNAVISSDTAYYILGSHSTSDYNYGNIAIWKFGTLGSYLWEKSYGDGYYFYSLNIENNFIKDGNSFIVGASKGHFTPPHELGIMLYKFDLNFDTIWTKNYFQDSVYKVSNAVEICSDGGYVMVGSTRKEAVTNEVLDEEKAFLLRTDSDGNYLWHNTYGTLAYDDRFYKVVQTPDGGFLCGGASQSYGSHTWDWYLVKTDANGIEEWHRTYGSMSYNDSRIMGITMTTDTNYIITGGIGLNGSDYGYYMKVLDNDFNLTKTVSAPTESIEAFYGQVKEIDEGFICIGGDRVNINNRGQTTLTQFDANFNEIWQRRYTVGDTTNTDNYISSVDTCSDGGFVMGGWAVHNGQKLGLIKTDSLGCDGTDWWECSTGVMVNAFVSNIGFDIYPNPVAKDNNVQCVISNKQLSSLREGTTKPSIEIYNLTGKLVKTKPAHISTSSMSASFTIDISNLESGIYLVKVGQEIQKLIIDN